MNVIIVDDEPLALDVLETYIERMPDLNLIARCNNAFEANEALKNNEIDLMFLDIQMPQLTGIEFLKTLVKPPMVIFTTAYQEATQAPQRSGDREAAVVQPDAPDYIFVKADKKLIRVKFSDILYIEGLKDYVIIRLEAGRVISLQTMKSLEDKLPPAQFVRVHRSYIVGMNKIQAIVGNMVEVMEKGQPKHLPIGKNYRDELLVMIDQHKL